MLVLILICVAGTLATGDYTQAVLQIGEKYKDTVIGFISTKRFEADPSLLFCTPGILSSICITSFLCCLILFQRSPIQCGRRWIGPTIPGTKRSNWH